MAALVVGKYYPGDIYKAYFIRVYIFWNPGGSKAMTGKFHLVCGATGAGKTTYARDLVRRCNGVHFSIDEWMVELFASDQPEPMRFDWIAERVGRCEHQIGRMAISCAQAGVAPVLDLSFLRASSRASFAALARQAGFDVTLHFLDVPADERWRRVSSRNETRDETFSLTVTRPMFDFIESIWEPPTSAEMSAHQGVYAFPRQSAPG
ncbi:AAA family ATPase [Bradyrhizobium sp. HKCCYLRH3083]|uniref:AAA family ATPase n=1 Tax=unclassified Bradyrhizobium TaxID=2631580 RepID=UPI003EBFE885